MHGQNAVENGIPEFQKDEVSAVSGLLTIKVQGDPSPLTLAMPFPAINRSVLHTTLLCCFLWKGLPNPVQNRAGAETNCFLHQSSVYQ